MSINLRRCVAESKEAIDTIHSLVREAKNTKQFDILTMLMQKVQHIQFAMLFASDYPEITDELVSGAIDEMKTHAQRCLGEGEDLKEVVHFDTTHFYKLCAIVVDDVFRE